MRGPPQRSTGGTPAPFVAFWSTQAGHHALHTGMPWCARGALLGDAFQTIDETHGPDMPLVSGRVARARQRSAPYQRPLNNTRPLHHQNSVGTCYVQRVAQ